MAEKRATEDKVMAAQVVVITGAGSGIGRATALAFAEHGAKVVLAGRRQAKLEESAELCSRAGGTPLVVPTDVCDGTAVKALFQAASSRFGRVDVLFNNAGGGTFPAPIEDVPFDQWTAIVGANITGPFLCTQEAIKVMKTQNPKGGRIINNGSISAHAPRMNSGPYTITKHAITGLTKSTALEGRRNDIACGQIDIGNALTDLTARMSAGALQADGSTASEPVMDVRLVAEAVVRMAELPLDANVLFMTIMATKMPYVGRG
jgi:NAD(P)-dependent dehydrogenase (short-subunit alcohol dehydrogenase family)